MNNMIQFAQQMQDLLNRLKAIANNTFSAIVSYIDKINNAVGNGLNKITNYANQLGRTVKSTFSKIVNTANHLSSSFRFVFNKIGNYTTKLGTTIKSTFNGIGNFSNKILGRNRNLEISYANLQKKIEKVKNIMKNSTDLKTINSSRRQLNSLQKQANRHPGNPDKISRGLNIGSKLGGLAGGAAAGLASMGATALLGLGKDAAGAMITGVVQKNKDVAGLKPLVGNENANQVYKNIRQDATNSPFDTESLLEANKSLMTAGLGANQARQDAMNLANAISAVGGGNSGLINLASTMKEISIAGKASSEDINNLGSMGINVYDILAKSTGKSVEQVKNMNVSYQELSKAFSVAGGQGGAYEGAMQNENQTMSGKAGQIKEKLNNALVDIGDNFSPIIEKFLDFANKAADKLQPLLVELQPYIDMIAGWLEKAFDYVMEIVNGTSEWSGWVSMISDFLSIVWGYAMNIFSSVWKIISGVIKWIATSEFIKDIVQFIFWIFEKILWAASAIGSVLEWVWESVLSPILDGFEQAYRWLKGILDFSGSEIDVNINKTETAAEKGNEAKALNDLFEKTKQPDPTKGSIADFFKLPANAMESYTSMVKNTKDSQYKLSDKNKTKESAIDTGRTSMERNNYSGKQAGENISGGGPRTINISVGKFFDNLNFNTLNNGQTSQELESLIMECLGRTLYEGAKVM